MSDGRRSIDWSLRALTPSSWGEIRGRGKRLPTSGGFPGIDGRQIGCCTAGRHCPLPAGPLPYPAHFSPVRRVRRHKPGTGGRCGNHTQGGSKNWLFASSRDRFRLRAAALQPIHRCSTARSKDAALTPDLPNQPECSTWTRYRRCAPHEGSALDYGKN